MVWPIGHLGPVTSETGLQLKYHKTSFIHNIYFSWCILLKFCTGHGSMTVVLCAKFQKKIYRLRKMTNKIFAMDFAWWYHQMETFSALLALCEGHSVDSPHKGQWHGALMFSLMCGWTNNWANNRDAGDLRRHHVHYDVTVMGRIIFMLPESSSLTIL